MTKSIDTKSHQSESALSEALLRLMDKEGMSLIKASQTLRIPFAHAKQILFTHGSNRAIGRHMSNTAKAMPGAR